MNRICLISLVTATALVPVSALAQGNECDQLVAFLEQNEGARAQISLEDARALQTEQDADACGQALQQVNAAAGSAEQPADAQTRAQGEQPAQPEGEQPDANIVVQQPAPTITVDQPAPQISVQQAPPNVTVRQPQPEIVVNQPAPVVTIEIPQPEIIVRMPQPEVSVEQAPPQVAVQESKPQVQVVQPEQPQVQVEQGGQAQVSLTQPEGAQVQVEQVGEAQVTYNREEPQVTINQAEGQPTIRVEQMDQQEAEQPEGGAALRSTDDPNAAAEGQEGEQQQAAATQGGDATANQPASGQMQTIAASDIEGMEVVNAEGEQIGTAEGLVQSAQDNKLYMVINQGGFLGLGEKRVALSLDGMLLAGDRIVIPNVTDEQIAAFPAFEANDQFPAVEGNMTADIRTAAQ